MSGLRRQKVEYRPFIHCVRGFVILSEYAGVGAPDLVAVSVVSKDAEHGFGAACTTPVEGIGHVEVLGTAHGERIMAY